MRGALSTENRKQSNLDIESSPASAHETVRMCTYVCAQNNASKCDKTISVAVLLVAVFRWPQ